MNSNINGLYLQMPWPPKVSNPNKKTHWAVKYKAARSAKMAGFYIARERGVLLDADKYYLVTLVFCPPGKYHYDLDNLIAAMKNTLDGMCKGLGIDDSHIKPVPDWGPMVKHGKVEVTIVEMSEEDFHG